MTSEFAAKDLGKRASVRHAVCYILSRIGEKVKQKKQKTAPNERKNQKISIKSMRK
jgi:hypothetical protein